MEISTKGVRPQSCYHSPSHALRPRRAPLALTPDRRRHLRARPRSTASRARRPRTASPSSPPRSRSATRSATGPPTSGSSTAGCRCAASTSPGTGSAGPRSTAWSARPLDLVHSPAPADRPGPQRGKQIVTLHDLFFLKHPEMVAGEVRRDYVALVRDHVPPGRRGLLRLGVHGRPRPAACSTCPPEKIAVTPHGVDPIFQQEPAPAEVDERLRRLAPARAAASSTSAATRSGRTW